MPQNLTWSPAEKTIARRAYDEALETTLDKREDIRRMLS